MDVEVMKIKFSGSPIVRTARGKVLTFFCTCRDRWTKECRKSGVEALVARGFKLRPNLVGSVPPTAA
jgi:hypothetical protein